MDEISKIGEINSVNDFFDFKLSIKTIILLVIAWSFCALVLIVFMLGGVNNTIDYATGIIESAKKKIIINKNIKPSDDERKKDED